MAAKIQAGGTLLSEVVLKSREIAASGLQLVGEIVKHNVARRPALPELGLLSSSAA